MTRALLMTLGGSALGLTLMLARRLLKTRLPSAVWYWAWLLVLLRLALPLPGLIPTAAPGGAQPAAAALTTPAAETYRGDRGSDLMPAGGAAFFEAAPSENVQAVTESAPEPAPAEPEDLFVPVVRDETQPEAQPVQRTVFFRGIASLLRAPAFWMAVWAAGAVLTMARTAASYRRFRRMLDPTLTAADESAVRIYRTMQPGRRPRLRRSPCVKTPMLLGLLHPLIVLPKKELPPETAENVLLHELTHYRRGDLWYKWASALVFALHWFNPLMLLFRRELDRVCELSCDERALRSMDAEQMRLYGETLLDLAAGRALPVGVVATTFATEKRDLKERLQQIMKYRNKRWSKAAAVLTAAALLLLTGCAAILGPRSQTALPSEAQARTQTERLSREMSEIAALSQTLETAETGLYGSTGAETRTPLGDVTVSTVDELLSAIRSSTTVHLAPGEYDLAEASNYGQSRTGGNYTWEAIGGGYELIIQGVTDFSLLFDGSTDEALILAEPRYADVLTFRDCADVTLSGFTAGHTLASTMCTGGVVALEETDDVSIDGCVLFGCGVRGITAEYCRRISAEHTVIKECSLGAAMFTGCYDVLLSDCDIHSCGEADFAQCVFDFTSCYAAAIVNSDIHDNRAVQLLNSSSSEAVALLGCSVRDNDLGGGTLFASDRYDLTVDGCGFAGNLRIGGLLSGSVSIRDASGAALAASVLTGMTQRVWKDYAAPALPEGPALDRQTVDGLTYVNVSTVDELLAAIGPDTLVFLAPGTYDLSTASRYGSYGGQYYHWTAAPGPGLVISGVRNFAIQGEGREVTEILAQLHSVDVMTFDRCEDITLSGFEAGHAQAAGGCDGVVLRLTDSDRINVAECGLYGCGRLGIQAQDCTSLRVLETEIYECSDGGVRLENCENCSFDGCLFRDNGGADYTLSLCRGILADGADITPGGGNVAVDPWMFTVLAQSNGPQPPLDLTFLAADEELREPQQVLLRVGEMIQLDAKLPAEYDEAVARGARVIYQQDEDAFTALTEDGLLTGLAPGDCLLLAGLVDENNEILCFGTLPVKVLPDQELSSTAAPIGGIVVTGVLITYLGQDEPGFSVDTGTVIPLEAQWVPATYEGQVTWTSSDETVATVSPDGVVTVVGSSGQQCRITAEIGNASDFCEVRVR